ncbi:hypothetical protein I601_0932 [Nocardioides dokdonensis FR1436]|uniref:Septum formation-related domain-containing protein n=1 Tax=Nocardioides dokdonensis FR1436 TaxID=1300347 RepID=A0A1A9GIU1_9ACTN|nr:septum formation family protein [Nocardioides dokdonensis]ANH37375.1 hypothetical protein I601_0932 [Nocardioides dokdonensis FR1436]
MLHPARALVAALSLSLLVLAPAPASSAGAAEEPAAAPDPMAGAPAPGTCYQLTHAELMADSTPAEPVECSTRHTAQVLDVGTLPDEVDWSSSDARVTRAMAKHCGPAFAEVVKDDPLLRARTVVQLAYFLPDTADREAGARWFRCDVSLLAGSRMLPLPEELPRVRRASSIDDSVGRCVTKKLAYTSCAKRHRYTHASAFKLIRVKPRTAQRQLGEAAARECPRRTSTKRWVWSATRLKKWHERVVVCYERG